MEARNSRKTVYGAGVLGVRSTGRLGVAFLRASTSQQWFRIDKSHAGV
jgi:hypothetical protein